MYISKAYLKKWMFNCLSSFLLIYMMPNQAFAEQVKVGVYSNKPLVFQDEQGEFQGLTIDVLRHIAGQEGWDLEFIPGSWAECLQKLEQGETDLQVAIAFSVEREKLFSYPKQTLITNWARLYRHPGAEVESLLDLAGKTVALLEKDIYAASFTDLMEKFGIDVKMVHVASYNAVLQQVQTGQVDGGVVNRMYAMQNALRFQVEPTPMIFNPIEVRYATAKGINTHLLQAIDHHLPALQKDKNSVYYRSLEKWFGQSHSVRIPQWVYAVLFIGGGLLVVVFIISMLLKRQVSAKTSELNRINYRLTDQVSQLQQAEEALQRADLIIKSSPVVLFCWKAMADWPVDFVSDNVAQFGFTPEELTSGETLFSSIIHPDDLERVGCEVQAYTARGMVNFQQEYRIITADEDVRWIDDRTKVVRDADGIVTHYQGIVIDITERKQAEKLAEQLHKAKRMESIGLMAGGVAHDLNNILSGIVGYPELILQNLPNDSKLRKPIEAIQESGERAARVVADLLTVAKDAASAREVHNLNVLIQEYLDSPECKNLKSMYPNVIYQHQLTATQPCILCSAVHVKKCLMNLVTNATEAIVNEGTITVSTYNKCIDGAAASPEYLMETGEYVVLDIQDTGPGISDEDLEHIFEPFYTKKIMGRSGTGLGLTVVWNTMEAHNGKVFVKSGDTETCFQLYFPVSKEEGVVHFKENKTEKIFGNNEYILIVDDEPQLRDIGSQMLKSLGYRVDSVSSGELAVELLKKKSVDLILIDMLMEPGMNGRQLYEKITTLYPNQKAVITSGFSKSDDVKAVLQLGADGFIKKPYSMEQLGRAVKKALHN